MQGGDDISISEAINAALDEELQRDKRVVVMGEEVGKSGGTHGVTCGLLEKYGNPRIIDTPICEMGFTGIAVGAGFAGLRPVVEFMTWNFALQSIDHIINSCAKILYMSGGKMSCPVVFRGPNGYNPGYAAQHTQDFSTYYGSVPGLKVVAPYSARDYYGLTKAAIRDNNPVVILESEAMYTRRFPAFPEFRTEYCQHLDSAVFERRGGDLTLIGTSISVDVCVEASKMLETEGIFCDVINLVSIRPLDTRKIFESVEKTHCAAVVVFSWPHYGIASEIAATLSERFFNLLRFPTLRICGEDVPTPYAQNLEALCFPTADFVVSAVIGSFRKS